MRPRVSSRVGGPGVPGGPRRQTPPERRGTAWHRGGVSDPEAPRLDYRWATHADPDLLALQLPPVPVVRGDSAHDAMKALFAQRGFRPVEEAERLDLRAANGCALIRTGPGDAELVVTIGARVGASRIPFEGVDPAWLARAVETGQAAVLVVDAAVRDDGTTSRELLRRDAEAGGVRAALVPVTERG